MTQYPAKFCLFCETATDDAALENAKEYIRKNKLTSDDVRILKSDTDITVWTKRDGVTLAC